jgi:hypothetical protein
MPAEELTRKCPTCGGETSEGGAFCQLCGADLPRSTPFADNEQELSRLRVKYSPLWVPVSALLATLLFLAMTHFLWQLQSGAFPRPGALWSALLAGVFACVAFFIGRALLICTEGFRSDEYAAAKKEYALAQQNGLARGKKQNAFLTFLRARPFAMALTLFTCAALSAGLLLPPETQRTDATAGSPAPNPFATENTPAVSAENNGIPAENTGALRLNGVWWNFTDEFDDQMRTLFNYVCIVGDTATIGTCTNTADVDAYTKSGVIGDSMTVKKQYTYAVKEAAFLDLKNMEEDYLCDTVLELYDIGGSLSSIWDIDSWQSLTMRDPEDPSRYRIEYRYSPSRLCTYSFAPAQGAATVIVTADPPDVWGIWVSIENHDDYTQLNYHNKADIPYVFFSDNGVVYTGTCTGANEMFDFIMSLPAVPENMDAYECSFTCEDAVYALNPDTNSPMVDACRIHVTPKPGEEPIIWEMGTGSILYTDDGGIFYWGEGCEWSAMG